MKPFLILCFLVSASIQASDQISVSSKPFQLPVVELYTSEGCSSCPPADEWLASLKEMSDKGLDVLPLAFHVDYWDYIGWKDRFASPANTSRQRLLGANNRQTSIYTPEFFVDGKEARGTRSVISAIETSSQLAVQIRLDMAVKSVGNELMVELDSEGQDSNRLHHRFFVYENNLESRVLKGENAGEHLKHQAVVRYMSPAKTLQNANFHKIPIDKRWNTSQVGIAAVITTPGSDRYLQAIHTPLSELFN
ncbi:MAG: hypothetical protein ACI845_001038 [Gammaproteobacteria bacterium]|jgi:hypothetical protein